MRNIALRLSYDGSNYHGWQVQKNEISVAETQRVRPLAVSVLFIFACAFGNFIDRVRQGFVVDFLELRFISFPVFNIADCYITWTAVVLIFLLMFRYKDEELKQIRLWRK